MYVCVCEVDDCVTESGCVLVLWRFAAAIPRRVHSPREGLTTDCVPGKRYKQKLNYEKKDKKSSTSFVYTDITETYKMVYELIYKKNKTCHGHSGLAAFTLLRYWRLFRRVRAASHVTRMSGSL